MKRLIPLLLPFALLLAACGGGSAASTSTPPPADTAGTTDAAAANELVGTVGPGFTIDLKQNGAAVTTLPAGSYSVAVTDSAATHDFALQAPDGTVTSITSVPETGSKTATVELTPGTWTYLCQPHADSMKGTFTVT